MHVTRRRLVAFVAAACACAVAACTGGSVAGDGSTSSRLAANAPTPRYPAAGDAACPPAAPTEVDKSVRDGTVVFRVLDARGPTATIVGTHAEFPAQGEFVRVRVSVQNPTAAFAQIDTYAQVLLDSAANEYKPGREVMLIKRQPDNVELGAQNEATVDLWYDVPVGTKVAALGAHGPKGCGRALTLPALRP